MHVQIPALDNGEFYWGLYAVREVLLTADPPRAQRISSYMQLMANSAQRIFYAGVFGREEQQRMAAPLRVPSGQIANLLSGLSLSGLSLSLIFLSLKRQRNGPVGGDDCQQCDYSAQPQHVHR